MIETGFEEVRRRAPWPAEAGERNTGVAASETNGEESTPTQPRPETVRFQGMRVAYFCIDQETMANHLILNRIVSLKEDTGKE